MGLFRTFIFLALVILTTFALTQGYQPMSPPAEDGALDLTDADQQAIGLTLDSADSLGQSIATAQGGVDVSQNNAQQINTSLRVCPAAANGISND